MSENGRNSPLPAGSNVLAGIDADLYDSNYRVPNFLSYNERVYRPFLRAVVKKAGLVPGQDVLDAGCGQGFFSNLLAESGLRVLGVDRSAEGVASASTAYDRKSLNFTCGNVLDLPYEQSFNGMFIGSCSLYKVENFSSFQKVRSKFINYLRPDGTLSFDYYTRLNKRVVSHASRYHDFAATRAHFAAFERAQIYFSLRAECAILGARSFSRWLSRFAELVTTYTILGGEIVVFLRREPDNQHRLGKHDRS